MADGTAIEWTDATVNAINGCTRVSPGCGGPGPHGGCYAERLAATRLRKHTSREGLAVMTSAGPRWTGAVKLNEVALLEPLRWRRPRKIFWNAHGDTFHEKVPDEWIDRMFAVMALTPQHIHQVLTKRPERMRAYLSARKGAKPIMVPVGDGTLEQHPFNNELMSPPNVWLGTSVEDQTRANERIPHLLATPAAVRFLSCEPLLGAVDLTRIEIIPDTLDDRGRLKRCGIRINALAGKYCESGMRYMPQWDSIADPIPPDGMLPRNLDWVICGGESGPKARPMHPDWARSLRDQCAAAGVPFFFKQWGEWAPVHLRACSTGEPLSTLAHQRVGKKAAGRLLDGVEHNGMPE